MTSHIPICELAGPVRIHIFIVQSRAEGVWKYDDYGSVSEDQSSLDVRSCYSIRCLIESISLLSMKYHCEDLALKLFSSSVVVVWLSVLYC